MDFQILGPLEVIDEGRRIALGGRRQRALLAVLLLHANETVTIDRLIDELWEEDPPAGAAKTVQVQVSRLRKALSAGDGGAGDRLLLTRGPGYQLAVDPERVDAHRFASLVADAERELAANRAERAASMLEEALTMWRGAPLADLAYEGFAQRESPRLEELRVGALELLIDAKLAMGRHGEVVGQLDGLITEHPYRERLRAQLMLALYRSERQADALQAYQDTRRALVEELGIEPGERLRELERAILAQDPTLQLVVGRVPSAQATASRHGAFVGREPELAELLAGLEEALAGRGRLFLLGGEPGIGKSRLADELVTHAGSRGAHVLVGRCWEAGGAPAYWPWVQALRAYVRESEPEALRAELGAGAGDLAQILPELHGRLPGLPEAPPSEPEAARFRLFDATAEFLRNASERRPILLVLDDLHAADAPSLLLLRYLARELGSMRVLLLAPYRDVDPVPAAPFTEMLAEVAREPSTRRLSLRGLSQAEVEEYVEATAGQIASPGLLTALHDETEGNPLFLGEIVRLLSVEGAPSGSVAAGQLEIPQSVRDVIARRLGHLSEDANRLLGLASVLGREFALDALARLGGVSQDELLEALEEPMAARIISEVPRDAGRLRFAHVLIRDALYDGLTTARRLRLHRQAVEVLETLHGDDGPNLTELARHAAAGGDFDRGLRYARRAGERELERLAYEEAARLYEAALELARVGEDSTRCELLLALGDAEARAGNTPAAKKAFLEAVGVARRLGLPGELARAAVGYGGKFLWTRASGDTSLVPLLEEALAALPDREIELRVRLLSRLAGALRDAPTRDRSDSLSREAVELAREGSPAAVAYALTGRVSAVLAPDTAAECVALATELRDLGERTGDRERMADGHFIRLMAQLQLGDVSQVEADLTAASRLADELRQPTQLWEACAARALLALTRGELAEAEELIERALELGARAQPTEAIPVHAIQRYTLCDFRGEVAEMEPRMLELAREYPVRPVFGCVLVHVRARLRREHETRRALAQLTAGGCAAIPFDQEWLYSLSLLAEASALLRDAESAPVLYELLLPWADLCAANYVEGIRGSVSRYLGLLAASMKRWSEAARHFEGALAANEAMAAAPWLAHTQNDYARMLLARGRAGDEERAQELAGRALEGYRAMGMAAG